MSEFQYYEFRTINRSLSAEERTVVDSYSSRGRVTAQRAVFTYSFSDFRHNAKRVLLDHFDYHLYFANWGTKRLMYRIPKTDFDYPGARQYLTPLYEGHYETGIEIEPAGDYYLITFYQQPEEGGAGHWYDEDEDYSTDLPAIFTELLRGDFRSLFIVWLQQVIWAEEELPPDLKIPLRLIPPGLGQLTAAQDDLLDFFEIDSQWITAAAEFSETAKVSNDHYEDQLAAMPVQEKDGFLLSLLRREPGAEDRLFRRVRQEPNEEERKGEVLVEDLVNLVVRQQYQAQRAEAAAAEAARLATLKETAKNVEYIHREIEHRLETKTGASYGAIMQRIAELHDLAIHEDREAAFMNWARELKTKSGRGRPSLLKQLTEAGY